MHDRREEQALGLIRSMRHSFMNHLQVISGWIQLNRPERAMEYLDSISAKMAGESEAIRSLSPGMAMALLEVAMEAESYDIGVEFRVSQPVGLYGDERVDEFRLRARAATQAVAAQSEPLRRLTIIFGPGDHFRLHTSALTGEG